MDSVTHVLVGFLMSEPMRRPAPPPGIAEERWRECLAVILGALIIDGDGVIGFFGLEYYERYHRVATHSILGMAIFSLICAGLARWWPPALCFPTLRILHGEGKLVAPPFSRLWLLASISIAMHFLGDWITAWGIWPFWPWLTGARGDFSLHRVNSLEPVLLALTTLGFAAQQWRLHRGDARGGWIVAAAWMALCALYVWLRPFFGEAAFV